MASQRLIYALASGIGRAGIAVIRLSGDGSFELTAKLSNAENPKYRVLARRSFFDPVNQELIDHGMVVLFAGPNSYTGEDVVEFHVHGGKAIIDRMFSALRFFDARLAEPGEFTRRAFLNGKMDLTEAEGVIDLIDAETEAQRKQALRQSEGALGMVYQDWSDKLIPVLAHREAAIDFSEEGLPDDLTDHHEETIRSVISSMQDHLSDNRRGERIRDGIRIAIYGPPNAGKSSLLNFLAQRDAAIVSERAGTTRDILEVQLDLGGYPVILCDTAGIRDTDDEIEIEGIRRALKAASDSDITILVIPAENEQAVHHNVEEFPPATLTLHNKSDLIADGVQTVLPGHFYISVREEIGLDQFLSALTDRVEQKYGLHNVASITRARHREAVNDALTHLERCLYAPEEELFVEDLRLSVRSLGQITGTVDVEDLLEIIFSDFCIGK